MRDFFYVYIATELLQKVEDHAMVEEKLDTLENLFPNSLTVTSFKAGWFSGIRGSFSSIYDKRPIFYLDYYTAKMIYEDIFERDPYRIADTDAYSHVLYLCEDVAALASLAKRCMKIDAYRPESLMVVGMFSPG